MSLEVSSFHERRPYLSLVEIDRLWGEKDISVNFRPDINILVGRNGSGKTTLLNIVADILLLDFEALASLHFDAVRLEFRDAETEACSRLVVERIRTQHKKIDQGFSIQAFDDATSGKPVAEQTISFQYRPSNTLLGLAGSNTRTLEPLKTTIATFINELASVTWISVHRKSPTRASTIQSNFDSSVDERLEHINTRFVEYITSIDNQLAKENDAFQKLLLKSLLLTLPSTDLNPRKFKKINLPSLRDQVQNMLAALNLKDDEQRATEIFDKVEASIKTIKSGSVPALHDLLYASYVLQMQKVVKDWTEYNVKRNQLSHAKYLVLYNLDEFMDDKDALLGQNGRVYFAIKDDYSRMIFPIQLSSGEKQIYILLMETLLSAGGPSIFIADEPELSLHVLWQEKLISAMRSLNENAQLIFATHSPDIIGSYSNHVHDMGYESSSSEVR